MSSTPLLSRFMPLDWQKEVLPEVEALFNSASPQHECRKWEYSQALNAIEYAFPEDDIGTPTRCLDVGGAGSPFANMLKGRDCEVNIVDPALDKIGIQEYVKLEPPPVDAVFTISVIEHVKEPDPFLKACIAALKPGGLFFLTTDAQEHEGEDKGHFAWMRSRIYSPQSLMELSEYICSLGMEVISPVNLTYPGHNLYGSYNFVSLAFLKLPNNP